MTFEVVATVVLDFDHNKERRDANEQLRNKFQCHDIDFTIIDDKLTARVSDFVAIDPGRITGGLGLAETLRQLHVQALEAFKAKHNCTVHQLQVCVTDMARG